MRPNPPRMVTVVLAVLLTIAGLVLIYFGGQATDLVRQLGLPVDLQRQVVSLMTERVIAYLALAISPLLLIAGSLLKGL